MLKNLTDKISFYCINGIHEKPVPMVFRERSDDGHDDFYACPKYMLKDDAHPDGHGPDDKACLNRLGLSDAGEIISVFNRIVDEDMQENVFADYTNFSFPYKPGIQVKVLVFSDKEIRFGVLNRRAVKEGAKL